MSKHSPALNDRLLIQYAIAERISCRISQRSAEYLKTKFLHDPLLYVFESRYVMVKSCTTYRRLDSLLARRQLRVGRVCNLLSPHYTSGAWDSSFAESMGKAVRQVSSQQQIPLLLLGRRVGDAVAGERLEFGESSSDGMLFLMPHPSGRSTIMSDPERRDAILDNLKEWYDANVSVQSMRVRG